ncbi:iron complex transport system ATP-binding protein [Sodalis ligni]|uniref:Iron complex transport system ATP-binding protein n=2 Tax=Sodalis ligni TaxID=2697027 RepID=A0A4R1NFM5_9GAMM|nr:heme ABC transporter ATP-binding protein [Sodalis ligni]TCL02920.1 iron complex transport system ATP-binding protein [Sodalis ligni]
MLKSPTLSTDRPALGRADSPSSTDMSDLGRADSLPAIDISGGCDTDRPLLKAEGVGYHIARRTLLSQVSLTLAPGEFVALIGPNGAGKSTLLRVLTGYTPPSEGTCLLNNTPLRQWPSAQLARQRAVMRQQGALTFPFTVAEVVSMGRAPWPAAADADIVDDVMALTGCRPLAQREFRQLSGGEQQRVRLARALAQLWQQDGPRGWLFLDEPTSALDLYHQQHVLRLLKRLTEDGRLAVCCVLHDLNLASLWSDRILLLHEGRLVAAGTPQDVLTEPQLRRWYQADVSVQLNQENQRPQIFLQR